MSEQAIEFLQEWMSEKLPVPPAPVAIEAQAERLMKKCTADAADAGVPLEEIVEEVGDLEELIAAKLEEAVEQNQVSDGIAGGKTMNRPAPPRASR
jgi:hypothetical protein